MRQSFEPKIWGPHAWFFIETSVMAYPEYPGDKDKIYEEFFIIIRICYTMRKM